MRHKILREVRLHNDIRQERQIARALDGPREHPVMLGTIPCRAAGDHLPALGDEIAKQRGVLVVHLDDTIDAETADFAARRAPALGASAHIVTAAAWTATRRSVSGWCRRCWHVVFLSRTEYRF